MPRRLSRHLSYQELKTSAGRVSGGFWGRRPHRRPAKAYCGLFWPPGGRFRRLRTPDCISGESAMPGLPFGGAGCPAVSRGRGSSRWRRRPPGPGRRRTGRSGCTGSTFSPLRQAPAAAARWRRTGSTSSGPRTRVKRHPDLRTMLEEALPLPSEGRRYFFAFTPDLEVAAGAEPGQVTGSECRDFPGPAQDRVRPSQVMQPSCCPLPASSRPVSRRICAPRSNYGCTFFCRLPPALAGWDSDPKWAYPRFRASSTWRWRSRSPSRRTLSLLPIHEGQDTPSS